ncbi:MAG: AbrB/MazE/SpoVT family DNA-binding domain-containing protein [Chloroflexi bacterium]|nr:AbrB/MazE/SpoVT family DNA-binding domain-containing protein [Chloroflexota bacterium]
MARRFYSRVSPKGQITLPAEVRERLDIKPRDRVAIELEDNVVRIMRGSGLERFWHFRLPGLGQPPPGLGWKEIEESAHEEHAEQAAREGLR